MNVFDEEEHNFNFDLIMNENSYTNINKTKTAEERKEPAPEMKKHIPYRSRFKPKKGKKLMLDHKKRERERERRRQRENNESRSYTCHFPECEKLFHDRNSYRKHLITHGDKQFICQAEGCGKRFLDNSKLKRHMLVHTGEKPYKCELCNKRFSLDFNLRTHLRIHTGEKPYVCSVEGCFKRFSQSSNLSAHEKTHFLPKENEPINIKSSNGNKMKKLFKVIRAPSDKPKPLIILDRHKYIDALKKREEEWKQKEEERLKLLSAQKIENASNDNVSKENSQIKIEKVKTEVVNEKPITPGQNDSNKIESNIDKFKSSIDKLYESPAINEKVIKNEIKTLNNEGERIKTSNLTAVPNHFNPFTTFETENNKKDFSKIIDLDQIKINKEYIIPNYLTREFVLKKYNFK